PLARKLSAFSAALRLTLFLIVACQLNIAKEDSGGDRSNPFERLQVAAQVGSTLGFSDEFGQAAILLIKRFRDIEKLSRSGKIIAHIAASVKDFHEFIPASSKDGLRGQKSFLDELKVSPFGHLLLNRLAE